MHACLCAHKMSSSQEAGFNALDDRFERFGPVEFDDVDAFIDSQFDRALGGEEEIFCSIPEDDSKKVIEREDGGAIAMAACTLKSFEFTYGNDTQIELDGAISLLPEEETERSGFICSRCREIVDKDDCGGCYASNKTTTTCEAASKGCAGGIELKGTQYMLTFCLS